MDGGAWWATVHRVAESEMTERLHFHFQYHLESTTLPRYLERLRNPGKVHGKRQAGPCKPLRASLPGLASALDTSKQKML